MSSASMLVAAALIAASVAAIVMGAANASPPIVMATCAATALVFVWLGIRARSAADAGGASRSLASAISSRSMAYVWLWGAAALFVVYASVLQWREWWQFTLGFAAVGLVSLGYSAMLARDAATGREDETMLSLGRYLAIGQLVGMIATVIGLAIDPDKELTWIREGDWAGNNIFLFGALGIGALTAHALYSDKRRAGGGS